MPSANGMVLLTNCMLYQNFYVTNTNDQKLALKKIEAYVEEIRIWMIQHRLMMNDCKTEFIVIISIGNSNKVSVDSITIGESNVPLAPSARNIGVIFTSHFRLMFISVDYVSQATKHSPCQTLPYA